MAEIPIKLIEKTFKRHKGGLPTNSKEKNPKMEYAILADGVFWTDEGIDNMTVELDNMFRSVLHHRTCLLVGDQTSEYKDSYNLAKKYFPDWVGFSSERCTYNPIHAERIERIRKVSNYQFDKFEKDMEKEFGEEEDHGNGCGDKTPSFFSKIKDLIAGKFSCNNDAFIGQYATVSEIIQDESTEGYDSNIEGYNPKKYWVMIDERRLYCECHSTLSIGDIVMINAAEKTRLCGDKVFDLSSFKLKEYEKTLIDLLVSDHVSQSVLSEIKSNPNIIDYHITGVGYFLNIKHPELPKERIVCDNPWVSGDFNDLSVGFVIFLMDNELTIDCHGGYTEGVRTEHYRDQNFEIGIVKEERSG